VAKNLIKKLQVSFSRKAPFDSRQLVEEPKQTNKVRYLDHSSFEKIAGKVFREHAPLFIKLAQ
jgi:hypothetical protein